jgi:undecaprenyl pyrophosphate phosphatase UppP
MLTYVQAIILGVLQGVTELFPVSNPCSRSVCRELPAQRPGR